MTLKFQSAAALVDEILATVGKRIVLGLPVGIGKAIHVADALFDRASTDPSISLTLFTGLTLETPIAGSDLERRFLSPFAARAYANWPTPKYATALREQRLPPNVQVHEFYLKPGGWLGNVEMQRSYTSVNYSKVAETLIDLGVNVIAQLVSARPETPGRYSLGSNPEISLDLLPYFHARRRQGSAVALVGQINPEMPWMSGEAELAADEFDMLLEDAPPFAMFGIPSRRVMAADFATGMHVASLIPDGGTLQLGIGSLSDAVAHCLLLRHRQPEVFRAVLVKLPGGNGTEQSVQLPRYDTPFEQGLFASSELMSDALFALFEANVIRRPAGGDDDSVIHAGFFVGSERFYAALRALPEQRRRLIRMSKISSVNTLFGDESSKRMQRRDARFINETMMVTLLGAAVSDGLEDGRVVSGVGGQFDFVHMAHELDDAQSILMCRARRKADGQPESNIRWSYAHTTVPRHFRDVVVSEYGVAALRSRSDQQVIEAMLEISDKVFLPTLINEAKQSGKLPGDYTASAATTRNTPADIDAIFHDERFRRYFPDYPLGSDFTPVEEHIIRALTLLHDNTAGLLSASRVFFKSLCMPGKVLYRDALERMALDSPSTTSERVNARLLTYALSRTEQ